VELKEKKLTSELVYDGGLLKVYYDTVELVNGRTAWREVIRHPGAVVMVPVDDQGNVYLERQFRYPYDRVVVEVPAGKLEWGEQPDDAARRELKEEIGAEAARWDTLGYVMPSVGYTDEMLYLFLARDLTFGDRHLDQDEFLEPFKLPFAQALDMAADGRINDAKTVAALFRADRLMRKEREDGNG